ncbi:MAG TPA: hypothetical protein VH560_04170 [Polyangia bacterium]|jgi:hypothetical protein|nr:hypothetical protein [Polyangia bacterium]
MNADPTTIRLAAPLLHLASRVLDTLPASEGSSASAAVRAFTEEASPARYLAATRALRAAERRHKLGLLGRAVGDRRTEQGLETLTRSAAFGPELLSALRALPADARNGRRLAIISDLLTAHRLIEARAAGALRELRQSLGPVPMPLVDRRRKRRGV